ncbi:sulfotransferase family protein [Lutibaculum baratangense]|uniref:Sulfotransferase n=1 Tax=Lutibaculum baratangense AMV1 TaxID=631454 RepID=V4T7W9_9HYPH|nr:sulfotransferase [Lutibaculum baratangense]ESR22703.1 hypothetical protein N177_3840 [Lutibaculum baratangense AMV1]
MTQTSDARSSVSGWMDFLGGLVERHPWAWIRLGGMESRLARERIEGSDIVAPIYVTGLARSGSTMLLELLARHEDVATHRYRDFPPVLTPLAWNWFVDRAGTREQEAEERAHKDRILVTPESPEAFEEVFWMAFFEHLHDPSRSSVLDGETSHAAFEAFYRDHIRKLLALRGGTRYLAKGNYNVTRLDYLLKLFPDARFVVPVRDPLWHIASLMKQHRLFCRDAEADPRVARHLRRTGHFEFGPDRRSINTGGEGAEEVMRLWRDGREVEGWALHWSIVYGHVVDSLERDPALASAIHVVRYEEMCADPAGTMSRVLAHCDLEAGDLPDTARGLVSAPSYYRPTFDAAEEALIRRTTEMTAVRLGYAPSHTT